MEILSQQQGSHEWHAHRAASLNASDAPVMMGESPYRSRQDLIRERATGIVDAEIDPATAKRFADGHRFEALARPIAEKIIGEELFPVVGKSGKYSASYDGLTLLEDTAFEHKTLGDALCYPHWDEGHSEHLPLHYRIQMEHQCMVCPTIERVLFMASRWDAHGTLLEERHCWYAPDPVLRKRIVAGWVQFEADVAAYAPEPPKAAPVLAAPQETLPAVSVRVDGELAIVSNLPAFGVALKSFIERIPDQPSTDQEFADTEAACKALKRAEDALEAAESNALAQLADVDAMRRLVADYRALARTTRLQREKLVSLRKDQLRAEIVSGGNAAARAHTAALNQRLGGHYMPAVPADFAGAIKGKKSLDSMRDAVADVLAHFKIAANEAADRIQANLASVRERQELAFLFPDVLTLVQKAPDDLRAVIAARIAEHEAKELARMDAERARIAAEERQKAEAAAQATAEAERARVRVEEEARARIAQAAIAAEQASMDAARTRQAVLDQAPAAALETVAMSAKSANETPPASSPTLRIGVIAERLGCSVTAEQLRAMGIEPAGKKVATLYYEEQFAAICDAIARRALQAKADHAARMAA